MGARRHAMNKMLQLLRRLWKAKTFSPEGFLLRALLIAVVFGASELLGLREYTTFLSGTSGDVSLSWRTASLLGLIHLLLYVGFILLVPILLIAAGLLAGWGRWSNPSGAQRILRDSHGCGPAQSGKP